MSSPTASTHPSHLTVLSYLLSSLSSRVCLSAALPPQTCTAPHNPPDVCQSPAQCPHDSMSLPPQVRQCLCVKPCPVLLPVYLPNMKCLCATPCLPWCTISTTIKTCSSCSAHPHMSPLICHAHKHAPSQQLRCQSVPAPVRCPHVRPVHAPPL